MSTQAVPRPDVAGLEPPPSNPRARARKILYLAGLLPLLLALAFTWKVTAMRMNDSAGTAAFEDSDGATALEEFAANRSLNWFEPWIAHFDTGNAAFMLADYERALNDYRSALDSVPHEQECSVRINMALSFEALGDTAAEKGDGEGARVHWQDGIVVLDDGECPTDAGLGKEQTADAAAIKKRLEEKLQPPPPPPPSQSQQPPPQQDQPPQEQQPQTPEERERERKRRELEERNGDGEQSRRDYRDLDDYDPDDTYQW